MGQGQGAVLSTSTPNGTGPERPVNRKLIEVSLPLEAINRESVRENYIYKGNPSSVHKWWAQRPLAAARAVLFAQLVDDPSSHPDKFPTQEVQQAERERLHEIIERLVVWENTRDQNLLAEAHEEILKSTDRNPPPIIDPFAGGGTIPLEAQRLGLKAHASDLNPVAVLINKALIEITPSFAGQAPVFPGLASERMSWPGATGLAADVRAYGDWLLGQAASRIGANYPHTRLDDGTSAPVIAWLWARTVRCSNPACGIEMPLVGSWWLSRKKGGEVWIRPVVERDAADPSGHRVNFEFCRGRDAGTPADDGTVGKTHATCAACGTPSPLTYLRSEGQAGRLGVRMLAMVAISGRRRVYLHPTPEHEQAANVPSPDGLPEVALSTHPQYMGPPRYGMTQIRQLFTNRQLAAAITFSDLVIEARDRIFADVLAAEREANATAAEESALAYSGAICTFLAFAVDKLIDYGNSLAVWYPKEDRPKNLFARQAIPMVWDFPEVNPLGDIGGSWSRSVKIVSEAFESMGSGHVGDVAQRTAETLPAQALISTDPPYYDSVPYADLSDFFYVWLRRALHPVYPELFATVAVPKAEELVANTERHGGKSGAKQFFEQGFRRVFATARAQALPDFPITVYYAFKQTESTADGRSSPGWEAILEAITQAGWIVTATWPLRSERSGRMRDVRSNALASSIVMALRPRATDAPAIDRRGFIAAVQEALPDALRDLQKGQISPLDLQQAAVGPGMAIFSRYSKVLEEDGSAMSVGTALERINEISDEVLNEQEGDFDPTTRFAIAWYRQNGYKTGRFGDANSIANARNTTVDAMARGGILTSAAGKVTLLAPSELPDGYDPTTDEHISAWEVLHQASRALEQSGVTAAAEVVAGASGRSVTPVDSDLAKELAFLLFSIAEKNGWTQDALAFNTLATSWPEIIDAERSARTPVVQGSFDFEEI